MSFLSKNHPVARNGSHEEKFWANKTGNFAAAAHRQVADKGLKINAKTQQTPLPKKRRLQIRAGHWPPSFNLVGGFPAVPSIDHPGRFSLLEGRFVGGGSCRVSSCLLAA